MAKQLGAVALFWLCFGCGGSSGNAPPAQEPGDEAKMSPASAPVAEETSSVADTTEAESTPSEPAAKEGEDDTPKRACDVLDKSTCKVTVGCAWNDVRKCVKE